MNSGRPIASLLCLLALASPSLLSAQEAAKITSRSELSIGQTIEFRSEVLGEERRLNVYLPLGYAADPKKRYPVIYLLDGSLDEDFLHIAGLVQFGSFSWIEMLPETIVVGIANVDRKRDFTYPTRNEKDKKEFPTTGGSAKFIAMIEGELQPLVSKNFRTDGARTIIGQSLGGLLATEILFKKPDLFDHYIIVSPSLWWDGESLLASERKPFSSRKSVHIGVGQEGETMERVARELHGKIAKGKPANLRLSFRHHPQLDHGDTLHLAVYDAFQAIFRDSSD